MTVLVTGATGLIGYNIVKQLVENDRFPRLLVRSLAKAKAILPSSCEFVQGDITDPDSIRRAMEGVELVYHAAGLPEQWLPDDDLFQQVNVAGTRHMVEAALAVNVQKFIYTSTIDVFASQPAWCYV